MNRIAGFLASFLPVLTWSRSYNGNQFQADIIAGVVVLFITVPQVIAYAFLAGMPAEAGLYAAMLSLIVYAIFGSSKTLAVGPTAIVAIMTLEVASGYASPGSHLYVKTVVELALVTGLVLIALRVIKFGAVVSFLSHAVVTGFISAAALLIISSQLPGIIGLDSSPDTSVAGVFVYLVEGIDEANTWVVGISVIVILLLLFCWQQGDLAGKREEW